MLHKILIENLLLLSSRGGCLGSPFYSLENWDGDMWLQMDFSDIFVLLHGLSDVKVQNVIMMLFFQ